MGQFMNLGVDGLDYLMHEQRLGDWREQIEYLLTAAYSTARLSPDPSTQVGAVIITPGIKEVCVAYNDIPLGIKSNEERLTTQKATYIEHAEQAAVHLSARKGLKTDGAVMIAPWASCTECAKAIIQSGIRTLVRHKNIMDATPERWAGLIETADVMMLEAGVTIIDWEGELGCPPIRFNGALWYP